MNRRMRSCLLPLLFLSLSFDAFAQPPEPIGPFVIDARGTLARFPEDAAVAQTIGVTVENLPTRGLGITVGGHVYPVRRPRLALGFGGEMVLARDSRTLEATTADVQVGPAVNRRFSSITPQISLNFGNRDGWSYISGGIGLARLTVERADAPFAESPERTGAFNYGGGARWFSRPHLAFTFDLRFYTVNARPASGTLPAHPRNRMMVISAGVSMR